MGEAQNLKEAKNEIQSALQQVLDASVECCPVLFTKEGAGQKLEDFVFADLLLELIAHLSEIWGRAFCHYTPPKEKKVVPSTCRLSATVPSM